MNTKKIGSIILGVLVLYFGRILLKKAFGGDSKVSTLSSAPIKVEKPDLSNPFMAELENMKGSCYENISNYKLTSALNVSVPYPCHWRKSKSANSDPNVLFCFSAPTGENVAAAIVVSCSESDEIYDADSYLKLIKRLPKTDIKDEVKTSTLNTYKIKSIIGEAAVMVESIENNKGKMAVFSRNVLLFMGHKVLKITYMGGAQTLFWATKVFEENSVFFDSSIARLH